MSRIKHLVLGLSLQQCNRKGSYWNGHFECSTSSPGSAIFALGNEVANSFDWQLGDLPRETNSCASTGFRWQEAVQTSSSPSSSSLTAACNSVGMTFESSRSDSGICLVKLKINRPCSTYQHSIIAPKLSSQNCKFSNFLLSLKENNTKHTCLFWKSRSHVRVWIYRSKVAY